MKNKFVFYVIILAIIAFLSLIGVCLAIVVDYIHEIHPEYFLGKAYIYILSVALSVWSSIMLHELFHVVGYSVCKYKIRLVYIFPFCVCYDQRKIKISLAFSPTIGIGGIVLPSFPSDTKKINFSEATKAKTVSLFMAPLFSLLYGAFSFILYLSLDKFSVILRPYFFAFFFSNLLVSAYIVITSLIAFGGVVGDITAGFLMLQNKAFAISQIYNDFSFQEDKTKNSIRKDHPFLNEIISSAVLSAKNEVSSFDCELIDIAIFEWITAKEPQNSDYIDDYLAQIAKNNFSCISSKLNLPNYSRVFCHIIIYLYIYTDKDLAKSYWDNHKDRLSSSAYAKYFYNQCEMLFYPVQNNEKIIISSLDSILNKLPNFYNDENDFNDILLRLIN